MINLTFISIVSANTANVSRSKQKGVLTIRGNCSYGVQGQALILGEGASRNENQVIEY